MGFERELELARRGATLAGENAIRIRGTGIRAERKADHSPVTAADRDNERLLVDLIVPAFPEDGILGEEGARKETSSGRRWIVDPIDGTRDFVKGNTLWCVLIALEEGGEVVLGVAHFPMLAETFWATRGGGAFRNGERLRVRDGGTLPANWRAEFQKAWSTGGARDAMKVAEGEADVWFERRAQLWDLAPLQVIIEEAGGLFFSMDGTRGAAGGSGVACTQAVEREVRGFLLGGAQPRPT